MPKIAREVMLTQINHADLAKEELLSDADKLILQAALQAFRASNEAWVAVDPLWNRVINLLTPENDRITADLIQTDQEKLQAGLDAWLNNPLATGRKELAIHAITNCTDELNLRHFQLNCLPPEIGLLTGLKALILEHNNLTTLPTEIRRLTQLREIDLAHNELASIPSEIGELTQLTGLQLNYNNLSSLPPEFGLLTNLTHLNLAWNDFSSLPVQIFQLTKLTHLYAYDNNLSFLPPEIGQLRALTTLFLYRSNISELPPEIGRLTRLTEFSIQDNPINHLQMSLGETSLTDLCITGTAIPASEQEAILRQCRSVRDQAVLNTLPGRLVKWGAYAERAVKYDTESLTVTQKCTLNEWLVRLENTKDFANSQSLLAKTVITILDDLKNPEFKEIFFDQAEANNTCCADRTAMSLNEIYTSWRILCNSQQEDLKIMVGVARTLRLRRTIDTLIAKFERERKRENPEYKGEAESVEIFLNYETELREELQLESAIRSMKYDTIGKRDWIDRAALIHDVNENYYEELVNIPLFEKRMQKEWEPITAFYQAKLNDLGECPKGRAEDTAVLEYWEQYGEIMQEWKRKKIESAKVLLS